MGEDNPMVLLSEVAEIIPGTSPQGKDINSSGAGLPFYQGSKEFGFRHPKAERFTLAPVKKAATGDVLLSVRAPVGRVNVADVDCAIGRGVMAVRAKEPEDGPYVAAVFESMSGSWDAHASDGTMFANLSKAGLERLPVRWPTDRARIAEVLNALDDRIGSAARLSLCIEQELQALFDVLVASDGQELSLTEIVLVNPPLKLPRSDEAPYIPMERVSTSSYRIKGAARRSVGSGARFCNGDTLVARITPCLENGKVGFVDLLNDDEIGWGSTEFIVMRGKAHVDPFIPYLIARSDEFRDYAVRHMSGSSGRQRCPAEAIERYTTLVPSGDGLARFMTESVPRRAALKRFCDEADIVRELREFLLPRLISGELRVTEAEKTVEEVL